MYKYVDAEEMLQVLCSTLVSRRDKVSIIEHNPEAIFDLTFYNGMTLLQLLCSRGEDDLVVDCLMVWNRLDFRNKLFPRKFDDPDNWRAFNIDLAREGTPTPLMCALLNFRNIPQRCLRNILESLLALGADANTRDPITGASALHIVQDGAPVIGNILKQAGASLVIDRWTEEEMSNTGDDARKKQLRTAGGRIGSILRRLDIYEGYKLKDSNVEKFDILSYLQLHHLSDKKASLMGRKALTKAFALLLSC